MSSEPTPNALTAGKRRHLGKGLLTIISFILLTAAGFYFLGGSDMQVRVAAAGVWGPIVFILLKASTIVIAPVEGTALYLIAGPLFGLTGGYVYLIIGDLLGHLIAFTIGRIFGRRVLIWMLSDSQIERIEHVLGYIGTPWRFIVSRVVLVSFGDALSYAAGVSKLTALDYIITTVPVVMLGTGTMMAISKAFVLGPESYLVVTGVLLVLIIPVGALGVWFIDRIRKKATAAPSP